MSKIPNRSKKEPRADQQNERNRDLTNQQSSASPRSSATIGLVITLQTIAEVYLRRTPSGQEAKEDSGNQNKRDGERQNSPIHLWRCCEIYREFSDLRGPSQRYCLATPVIDRQSQRSARAGNQEGFSQ